MKSQPCIRCGSTETITGTANPIEGDDHFRPLMKHGLTYWLFHFNETKGVPLKGKPTGCLSCGLIWGEVPPEELRQFAARRDVRPVNPAKGIDPEL